MQPASDPDDPDAGFGSRVEAVAGRKGIMNEAQAPGLITNVQRFSIHDGPGIRTTVFLKGCPLHCFWCHNPEARRPRPEVQWFVDRCIGCEACIAACPQGAQARDAGRRVFWRDRCEACGRCVDACSSESLVMAGRWWTAEELLALLLRDREFYERSGGGVTLSGGEPVAQPRFSRRVLALCRQANLRTAVETAAFCPWDHLAAMLPYIDLIILDLKVMDAAVHQAAIGVPNRLILENARRLAATRVPLVVRTPVVPGINDTPEAIAAIAGFIRDFAGLQEYELMPFHGLARGKYASLGLEYAAEGLRPPSRETLTMLAEAAQAAGVAAVKIA